VCYACRSVDHKFPVAFEDHRQQPQIQAFRVNLTFSQHTKFRPFDHNQYTYPTILPYIRLSYSCGRATISPPHCTIAAFSHFLLLNRPLNRSHLSFCTLIVKHRSFVACQTLSTRTHMSNHTTHRYSGMLMETSMLSDIHGISSHHRRLHGNQSV